MKKITPTAFIYPNEKRLLLLRFLTKNRLLLMVLLVFSNVSAQQSSRGSRVVHLNQFLASQPASDPATLRTKSLLKDLQPSVYLTSGEISVYGDNPVCLFTDVASIATIVGSSNQTLHPENIEMVTININKIAELSSGIDLSVFTNFPKLKYIYIQSNISTTASEIISAIRNNDPRFRVFYDILKTS